MSRHDSPLFRPLPEDYSRKRLFLPDPSYPYFQRAGDHPFGSETRDFSSLNAWWLAELAMLVYFPDPGDIKTRLISAGFTRMDIFDCALESRENTRCLWVEHPAFAVACFRGSEPGNPKDYLTDARFLTLPLEGDARVHGGFKRALEADGVVERLGVRIEDWRRSERPVWLTGHSLGAALATLAAQRFGEVSGVYSIGAPRVGNEAFWRLIQVPVYRVVNAFDLVTTVPPVLSGQYDEGGDLRYIDSEGTLHAAISEEKLRADRRRKPDRRHATMVRRWMNRERDQIPLRSISDHSPLHYALHLWNNYVATAGDA
jgi:hypothetical protein